MYIDLLTYPVLHSDSRPRPIGKLIPTQPETIFSEFRSPNRTDEMPFFTTKDGTELYYKIWGPETGAVVVFSHGWPLNADSFEAQMFFLANHGFRCVAHDRRGHGRSGQPWEGNNMSG
jgi:predicted acyl esterase